MTKLTRAAAPLCSIFTGALLLAGCAVDAADEAPIAEPPAADAHAQVGSFVMHVRPRESRVEVRRLPAEVTGPARFSPQNFDSLPIVSDDVAGSGPDYTVELATTSVTDTYNAGASGSCPAASFCGDVQLTHFYRGLGLSAVYVQVTAITDANGAVDSTHKVTNGITSNPFGIDVSLGTWQYTTLPSSLAYGTGATKTWAFANPDDKDFYVYLDVKAALYPMIWWNTSGPVQTAPLVGGQPAIIHYNYARNGACRGTNWIMNGFFRGSYSADHQVSFTGSASDTYFDLHITTPFGSANGDEHWFNNTDQGGCQSWDSNGGANWKYTPTSASQTTIHFKDPTKYGWTPSPAQGSTLSAAGSKVTVSFEPRRIACNLDRYDRIPAGTTLEMGYMFNYNGGTVAYVDLTALPYGVPGTINGASGRMYMPASITVPAGTTALSVWFKSTGPNNCLNWDSNNSSNYNFTVQ
ncbi:MAG: DUF6209 family protein [Minicystis sp.]